MPITPAHWVFLFTVATIVFVMVARRNVAIVAIAGTVALAFMSPNAGTTMPDRMIFATQSLFRSILMAGIGLFDIMLLVALMLAMLKAMSKEGADELMIVPVRRLIVGPRSAFITLACTTFVCGIFFWPSPATALVGTVLVPVAIRARLPAVGAVAAINIAGHGMALSSDPVIQAATRISASAAHVSPGLVLFYTVLFAGVVGIIALTVFGLLLGRDMRRGTVVASPSALPHGQPEGRTEFGPHARFLAILTPAVLFGMGALIISRALFDPAHAIYGGDATALLGGCAVCILIIACVVHDGHHALEQIIVHLREGFAFAVKVFAPVLPIVAFFFLGDPDHAAQVLGPGTPGFLLDLGRAASAYLGPNNPVLPFGVMVVGILSGIDGFGFSGLPLTGSIAGAVASSVPANAAILASIGQIGSVWVGGGTIVPWSGVCVAAAMADVNPDELARRNFLPVALGFLAAATLALFLIYANT
ncbi:hypothetical protein [Novosphingobium naphthalenivorans]|uniref:hypothetical protein n=1 Tax=Novosphingobium naphthalenivorans TaxID=273168 RepID=UPI00082C36E7|nr:hypothetical protein [Novosphingobium naphthalenivorans]